MKEFLGNCKTQFPNEWLILYEILCISNKNSYWFNEILETFDTLIKKGSEILDIGGESTRPGAKDVNAKVEWKRIYPTLMESILPVPSI